VVSEAEPEPEELPLVPEALLPDPEPPVLELWAVPVEEPVLAALFTALETLLADALFESAGSCPETSWTAIPSHAAANRPADQAATRRLIMCVRRSRASIRARPTATRSGTAWSATSGPANTGEGGLLREGVMVLGGRESWSWPLKFGAVGEDQLAGAAYKEHESGLRTV
jgi:hypothetical protein